MLVEETTSNGVEKGVTVFASKNHLGRKVEVLLS